METAPLKSFATWARTALIREVTARIAVVLAPGSPQRVEQPNAVAALEAAITAAGGGEKGRGAVVDRAAYTWFNRIIALRFMDANGYTGIGVVSPQAGVEVGQPEILAEAKRANIDPDVVDQKTRETVTGLLNGTRRSDDPQGEAYANLLVEYCRHWNRAMPFMFEREGDFTELLMPANLLADGSVLNRSVRVLSEYVCQDVEVIGWLYQFYISERKDEVFAGFKKNKKAGAEEIAAATQLFTPHWIVRYIVENSLGRLWMLNHPGSRLADSMDYYIPPVDTDTEFCRITRPEDLKLIDPACGSGHILTYAFDLLCSIYEEEGYAKSEIPGLILAHNLYGTEIDPRAAALAAFALVMKARSWKRRFFDAPIEPKIAVLKPISFTSSELDLLVRPDWDRAKQFAFWNQFENSDVLGSLIRPAEELVEPLREHVEFSLKNGINDLFLVEILDRASRVLEQASYLSSRYNVVVANPPYMGNKNMGIELSEFAKKFFPSTKSDLFSMFIERCRDLCPVGSQFGFMSPFVWMFIATYAPLRSYLIEHATITSLIQLEYSGFEGATVPICCFTFQNALSHDYRGAYIKLSDFVGPELQQPKALEAIKSPSVTWFYRTNALEFGRIPGKPIVFWASEPDIDLLSAGPRISDFVETREGLTTGDNARFLRLWFEVSAATVCWDINDATKAGSRWFPYIKGGEVRRWFGNLEYVVDWENDGARQKLNVDPETGRVRSHNYNGSFAFREGFTWSGLSSSDFSVRYVPPGFMFDAKGPMGFVSDERELLPIVALLNSSLTGRLMRMLAPTLDFKLGHVLNIPVRLNDIASEELRRGARAAITLAREDWDEFETSFGFSDIGTAGQIRVAEWARSRGTRRVERTRELSSIRAQIDVVVESASGLKSKTEPHPEVMLSAVDVGDSRDDVLALASYAVGCMFGRYSLDEPGLMLADEGATLQDYVARVLTPNFMPDADNVIPVVDGDWFEDDIVTRFRQFLRVAFGEKHFEENLRFVADSLGVKDLRDYFVKSFYKDHVQRYKKRPIYWLFSSPKGSFNALIYMHRYTPSTVSTVLNEYLREFKAKLEATLGQQERLAAGGETARQKGAAQKEADRIRKMLLELDEYEHDVLYPLASQQIEIDLDDGVRVNYPKFGTALKKIPGLEAGE